MALGRTEILVIEAPDRGYVQFINEGPGLLGECSDPAFYESLAFRAHHLDEEIRAVGWGPIDAATGSPNYRAKWYPDSAFVAVGLDPADALDAANMTVKT